ADTAGAEFQEQFAGGLGFRDDENFAQHATKSKGRCGHVFFETALAIEKDPHHVFDMHETNNVIQGAAINREPRALRRGEGAHHVIEAGLDGKRMHVRLRNQRNGTATNKAMRSGRARLMVLGTSSPMTTCSALSRARAQAKAIP